MNWKKELFQNFKLYAVTDIRRGDTRILDRIRDAYQGGADIVQLRSKELTPSELYALGLAIRKIADEEKKLYFVNDSLGLALATQADGLHLGQTDLPLEAVKRVFRERGGDLFVGQSTHRIEQALQAARQGADYIGVGPVFSTPSKPGKSPVGLSYVREAEKAVSIPFVAIGGIDRNNITEVLQAGARRIAVIRAVFDAADSRSAAAELVLKIKKTWEEA